MNMFLSGILWLICSKGIIFITCCQTRIGVEIFMDLGEYFDLLYEGQKNKVVG